MSKNIAFVLQYNKLMQPNNPPQFNSYPSNQPTNGPGYTPSNQNVPEFNDINKKNRREDIKNVIYTALLFIFAPLFAIFMILFVFQSYVVDGSSMEPTLQNGNRVFILKLPKSISNLKGDTFIPTRNEVVVFKKPSDPSIQLIKRVIALPGERVTVKDGKLTVYNNANPNGFNPDAGTDHENTLAPINSDSMMIDEVVGANEIFVMGDNRTPGGSLDSHSGLGLVPAENIVGRLWVRYFPVNEFRVFAYSFLINNQQYRLVHSYL